MTPLRHQSNHPKVYTGMISNSYRNAAQDLKSWVVYNDVPVQFRPGAPLLTNNQSLTSGEQNSSRGPSLLKKSAKESFRRLSDTTMTPHRQNSDLALASILKSSRQTTKGASLRWFKHYTDNYRGRSIERFYQELGHTGVSCYYLLTEICAEKIESGHVPAFIEDECRLSLSIAFVKRTLRVGDAKMMRLLSLGDELGLFTHKIDGSELHIQYPILLDLLDSDSKRARSRREQDATKQRLELELDGEKERDKEAASAVVSKLTSPPAVKLRSQNSEIYFETVEELQGSLNSKTIMTWCRLYPDEAFLRGEVLKAFHYYTVEQPRKTPKTLSGWSRAISSWLNRGWPRHVKNLKPDKASKLDWSQVFPVGATP